MLLRHIVPNNCAPFECDAITYASETLDRLLAGVKWRRSPCHDWAAIIDARFEKTWLTPGNAGLFQRREGSWRQDLIADACNNRSIAFALVAHLVPSRVIYAGAASG